MYEYPKIILTEVTHENSPVPTSWIIDMYVRYLNKLKPYNKELQKSDVAPFFKEVADEEIKDAVNRKDTEFLLFFDKTDINKTEPLGFAIVGNFPNAYNESDIYIQEFYVDKRRCGIGKKAVSEILQRYDKYFMPEKTDVSMFILEENFQARIFWKNVMEGHGFVELVKTGEVSCDKNHRLMPVGTDLLFKYWSNIDALNINLYINHSRQTAPYTWCCKKSI